MILVIDTETTGIPQRDLPADHSDQVRLVEFAAVLCDEDGTERACVNFIVQPDGWTVPDLPASIHGITTEVAQRTGVPVHLVLDCFANLLDLADEMVAYNAQFDKDVMSIELIRAGEERPVEWPHELTITCACEAVTPVLNLPPTERMLKYGHTGPRRPKLAVAYETLFNEPMVGAHGALADARACARIHFHLKKVTA